MAAPSWHDWLVNCDDQSLHITNLNTYQDMTLKAEFVNELPSITETVWPKHRFTTYEPSDEAWALPVGYAKRIARPINLGDPLTINVAGNKIDCRVSSITVRDSMSALIYWVVTGWITKYHWKGETDGMERRIEVARRNSYDCLESFARA